MKIGAHVRSAGGLVPAIERGADIGAITIQVFTQSPRAWKPTQYAAERLDEYKKTLEEHSFVEETYCHATYLINLASADPALLERSLDCLGFNLSVACGIGAKGLVLHIGSHKGAGIDGCIPQVARCLDQVLAASDGECPILLENAAGAGGTVGRSFEELQWVIDKAKTKDRLGVCLDTQHLFASGVGFSTIDEADSVMEEIDQRIGLTKLRCIHLNDSKVPFGANRDRHANIGEGEIGESGLAALVSHPALKTIAGILEVPGEGDGPRSLDVEVAKKVVKKGEALRAKKAKKG